MTGHNIQNRDRGYRHHNPKPHPHKKATRVPGKGRYREEGEPGYWHLWFAWNCRRELKFPTCDINPIVIAKEYEHMSANMYRHNLEAKKTFDSGVGWTRTGPALVRPEQYRAEMFPKRGLVGGTKREMLGAGRVGRMKKPGGMIRKKGKCVVVEVKVSGRLGKSEVNGDGMQAGKENQAEAHDTERCEEEDSEPCRSKTVGLEESKGTCVVQEESDWIEVGSDVGLEPPGSDVSVAKDDDYVVI
ncbi:hypothetical protein BDZ45DRAFT_746309 [Acephala macrosclerotiorum]|nr:hypothetical protein BDZ45DRAFT_746309 [Acephala macrosclerotiorum]